MTYDKKAKLLQAMENKTSKFHELAAATSTLTGALAVSQVDQRIKDMSNKMLYVLMEYAMTDGALAEAITEALYDEKGIDDEHRNITA